MEEKALFFLMGVFFWICIVFFFGRLAYFIINGIW